MSSSVILIQVAGLSDVPEGQSRIDGLPDTVVTLTSTGSGSTHEMRFFDVTNPGVGTPTNPTVPILASDDTGRRWTFTPPGGADAWGQSFGIELVVDRGLSTQVTSRRKYAIPTYDQGLILPVFSEAADPQASLQNHGALQVAMSTDNADGNWRGYHPRLIGFLAGILDKSRIRLSPVPQVAPALMSTTPTHVATVQLEAGSLVAINADIGDLSDAGEETNLKIVLQSSPSTVLALVSVSQLKVWKEWAISPAAVIATRAAYEILIYSTDSSGNWACKGIELVTRNA